MKYAILCVALLLAGCDSNHWKQKVTMLCDPVEGVAWSATDGPGWIYYLDRVPSADVICAKGKQ